MMERRVNRFLHLPMLILALGIAFCNSLFAQGHYLPGMAGLKSAVTPPQGFYYANTTASYTFGQINDPNGKPEKFPGVINVMANISSFTYMTDAKIFGARYGLQVNIPVTNRAYILEEEAIRDVSKIGFGDIYVQPLTLGWGGTKNQLTARYGFFAPVGRYSPTASDNTGKGFWTHMLTAGDTYLFGKNNSWNASGMFRYETNTKQDGVDFTPGDDIILEWGVGRKLGSKFELGVTGASTWQATLDKGPQASANKYSAHAVGGEVRYAIPQARLSLLFRANFDVAAYQRGQGSLMVLGIVWRPWE